MKQVLPELTNSENARLQVIDSKRANRKAKLFSGLNQHVEERVLRIAAGDTEHGDPTSLRIVARIAGTTEAICLRILLRRLSEQDATIDRLRARVVFGSGRVAA